MIVMTHPLDEATPAEELALWAAAGAIERAPETWSDAAAVQRIADAAAAEVLAQHGLRPSSPWMTAYVWQHKAIVVRQDRLLSSTPRAPA
jgi:hypothetical protein